jgi:hypothetical protein
MTLKYLYKIRQLGEDSAVEALAQAFSNAIRKKHSIIPCRYHFGYFTMGAIS